MRWLLVFCLLNLCLLRSHPHFDPNNFYRDIKEKEQSTPLDLPLLRQPFTYLGEGSQMVVFGSEDGAYVLKLFKGKHKKRFKLSRFLSKMKHPIANCRAEEEEWKFKFKETCRRYEMAFSHLKEETALVLLHFQKTGTPLPVTLIDKSAHRIDLSGLPFILQKRAVLAPEYFRKNPGKHIEAVQALKDFFVRRIHKGFSDPRQTLNINYGFIDDSPVQLDVGKIEPFQGDIDTELKEIHRRVDLWISRL